MQEIRKRKERYTEYISPYWVKDVTTRKSSAQVLLTSLEECHLHPELDRQHFAPPEQSGTKEILNLYVEEMFNLNKSIVS